MAAKTSLTVRAWIVHLTESKASVEIISGHTCEELA